MSFELRIDGEALCCARDFEDAMKLSRHLRSIRRVSRVDVYRTSDNKLVSFALPNRAGSLFPKYSAENPGSLGESFSRGEKL